MYFFFKVTQLKNLGHVLGAVIVDKISILMEDLGLFMKVVFSFRSHLHVPTPKGYLTKSILIL